MNKNKPFGIDGNTKFKSLDVAEIHQNWALLHKAPAPEKMFQRVLAGVEGDITPDAKVEMVLAGSNSSDDEVLAFMTQNYGQPDHRERERLFWEDGLPAGIEIIVMYRNVDDEFMGRQVIGILFAV